MKYKVTIKGANVRVVDSRHEANVLQQDVFRVLGMIGMNQQFDHEVRIVEVMPELCGWNATEADLLVFEEFGRRDAKVPAIKFVRLRTRDVNDRLCGLKEAKDWVDQNIKFTPAPVIPIRFPFEPPFRYVPAVG